MAFRWHHFSWTTDVCPPTPRPTASVSGTGPDACAPQPPGVLETPRRLNTGGLSARAALQMESRHRRDASRRVPAKLRASSWGRVCCRIRGWNRFPGLFHPTPAYGRPSRPQQQGGGTFQCSGVDCLEAWAHLAPFLGEGPSQLFLCQHLRGKWEKAKATWAPGTLHAGWWWLVGRPLSYKDQRGTVTCLRAPSNGRAGAGSRPSRPRAACTRCPCSISSIIKT